MSLILERQLRETNGDARETARQEGAAALPTLRKYASDESPDIRSLVMECYAGIKGDEAVAALAKGLDDPEMSVRKTAVLMLHQVNSPVAVPKLQEEVAKSPDPFVRGQSALILGRIGDASSIAVIKKAQASEKDARAAHQMALAAARLGDEPARQQVLAALLKPGQRERYDAIADFEYVNDPSLAGRLEPLLGDTRAVRNIGPEPFPVMHRVCDRAVEAVSALFPGKLSFQAGARTYTAQEIEEARKLANRPPAAAKP